MKPINPPEQAAVIKPFSKKELSVMYNVSKKTMSRWLQPHLLTIGKREGHTYTVKQVTIIFELLGPPDCFEAA